MKTRQIPILTLAAIALIGSVLTASATTTIVYESFGDTGLLNGSMADTGQTWASTSPAWTASGGYLLINGTGGYNSISGLTFVPNCIYTLSMDIIEVNASPTNGWIAMGFYGGAGNPMNNGRGSMLVRSHENNEVQTFAFGTSVLESFTPSTLVNHMAVELTTGSTLANSTLRYLVNGVPSSVGGTVDANAISSVFLQTIFTHTDSGVDNFRLTHAPVPEPSAAMLGLGALGLMLRRRRK